MSNKHTKTRVLAEKEYLDDNSEALSGRVTELITAKGITQYRLAQLSGIAESTIADIRKMRNRGTNIQNINAIAQGLGMGLDEFFASPLFLLENITD